MFDSRRTVLLSQPLVEGVGRLWDGRFQKAPVEAKTQPDLLVPSDLPRPTSNAPYKGFFVFKHFFQLHTMQSGSVR